MTSPRFYFAFPDGVLHYDCARCTALCCRGLGIAAHDRELVQLLRHAPLLTGWATKRNRKIVEFASPTGHCYFLDQRERCSIEEDLGRAHKPSLCKAFPFHRVSMLAGTHVVSPHFLCPITLELPRSDRHTGDHARLATELEQVGWLDQDFAELSLHAHETAELFLAEEIAFRDACARSLDGGNLRDVCGVADDLSLLNELLACPVRADAAIDARCEAWFLALAPIWSVELSHLATPARRRALVLARSHLGHALGLAGSHLTLQVCHGLWTANSSIYELLAQADEPMPAGLLNDTGDAATLLAAALIDRMAKAGASVREALREGCRDLGPLDRQALLNALGAWQRKRAAKPAALAQAVARK